MNSGHGGDIYLYAQGTLTDFSANVNPFGTPPEVVKAVSRSVSSLGSYPDCYCRALREKLAAAHGCGSADILCGNGAAELVYSIVYAKKPKRALLVPPCFSEYEAALLAAGAEICYYETSAEDGFLLRGDFETQLSADLDMVFLCVPNNPTGTLIPRERLIKIADICEKNEILLVLDECFNEFLEKPEAYSMLDGFQGRRQLVILKSFTKMFALAGLRLGYAVSCNHALFDEVYSARQPWAVSTPAQAAGIAALSQGEFVKSSREYLQKERKYLESGLSTLGLRVFEGTANFVFFEARQGLKDELLKKGFLIRCCGNYRGLSERFYRAAVLTHEENERLVEAVECVFYKKLRR